MSSSFGQIFKISTFGESHGAGIGVVVDGVPSGIELFREDIQKELDRRRPGQSLMTTKRSEADQVEILSGVFRNTTTGAPIGLLIRNKDTDSSKYDAIEDLYRPGHADYTYDKKYALRDHRGGGRSSGRETACRVAAGAIARKMLKLKGIDILAATIQVQDVYAQKWLDDEIENNSIRTADPDVAEEMANRVKAAMRNADSVGGVLECRVKGLPVGLGEPLYDKLDAMLAHAMFSIGTVRGLTFGNGFEASGLLGSENNDAMEGGSFASNRCGGILGGLSNGMPIIMKIAIKPTPSIATYQATIDKSGQDQKIRVEGRHDPCICPRAVPVVEAMTALVLADAILLNKCQNW
ncbi:MAG: chorismate synthase [Planctomycetes bacterium]|nr:chorismate synthase [Planctomycetota bacterium]